MRSPAIRTILGISCGLLLGATFAGGPVAAAEEPAASHRSPPNVLMICIDDLNDWTGFLGGHPQAITPHMDALAKRGVSFTNAHCAVPVCSASRVSVMSGLGATTHGSYELGPSYQELPALRDIPTLQRCFQNGGYLTLEGGKVLHHGFTGRLAADIDHPLGRPTSPRPPQPLNRPRNWSGAWDWGAYPQDDADMADMQLAHAAAAAMHAEYDQPFFLSVGFFRPHVPLYVPPHWFGLYDEQQLTLPNAPLADLSDLPANFLSINEFAAAPTHADVVAAGKQRSLTHAYLASVSFVDHCVGVVLDALAESPHADNTVVVLWSDHGFHLGEKQHWAKRTLWEESTRVPLLVAGPGIPAGGVCQEPASLIDLYPTLLELSGLPARSHTEGLSLVPQLRDPATPREQPAITSSYEGNHAVRSRDWRLIAYRDGSEELYDHRRDPDEFENLAAAPEHLATLQELRSWLPTVAADEFKPVSEQNRTRKRKPATEASVSPPRPNIVVIVSDDAGYNEFSMHGSTICPTPRIDSIATKGVRFSNGYVSGSVCSPTRAGLLTGRYQTFFGHEFNIPPTYSEENGLPLSETTIADGLRGAGYRTIALGKWHLGYAPKFHPMQRGFTDYYGFLQGARSYFPLTPPTELNQLLRNREPQQPENFGYLTDELAHAAVEYIKDSKDSPFFIYLAFNATHTPLHTLPADEAAAEKLSAKSVKIRAMTIALDRAVGMVIDGLEQQGLLDNTLLVFVNDNGGATGHDNFPLRGQKGQTWEGGIRVPFAMQWPAALPSGQVYEYPVIALDIFPTAMAAAAAPVDEKALLSGVNLLPHLTGATTGRPHQTLYWKNGDKWAVRDGDFKLVAGNPDQQGLNPALYNLAADISEENDLASTRPDDVARLTSLYNDWNAHTKPTLWQRGSNEGRGPRRNRQKVSP